MELTQKTKIIIVCIFQSLFMSLVILNRASVIKNETFKNNLDVFLMGLNVFLSVLLGSNSIIKNALSEEDQQILDNFKNAVSNAQNNAVSTLPYGNSNYLQIPYDLLTDNGTIEYDGYIIQISQTARQAITENETVEINMD